MHVLCKWLLQLCLTAEQHTMLWLEGTAAAACWQFATLTCVQMTKVPCGRHHTGTQWTATSAPDPEARTTYAPTC